MDASEQNRLRNFSSVAEPSPKYNCGNTAVGAWGPGSTIQRGSAASSRLKAIPSRSAAADGVAARGISKTCPGQPKGTSQAPRRPPVAALAATTRCGQRWSTATVKRRTAADAGGASSQKRRKGGASPAWAMAAAFRPAMGRLPAGNTRSGPSIRAATRRAGATSVGGRGGHAVVFIIVGTIRRETAGRGGRVGRGSPRGRGA